MIGCDAPSDTATTLSGRKLKRLPSGSRFGRRQLAGRLVQLLDTSQKALVDCVVVVDAPEALQLQRTVTRDSNDEAQVKRIMAAQMARDKRLELADIVIDNSGTLEDLNLQVDELHKEFLLRAESSH